MAFGDPWEGHVDPAHAADLAASLHQAGCEQIALGDTIGTATPGHVRAVLRAIISAGVPKDVLAPHFHDTYGTALVNVHAALDEGVTTFDASAGASDGAPSLRGPPVTSPRRSSSGSLTGWASTPASTSTA